MSNKKPHTADQIEGVATQLAPNFIPKDTAASAFSFDFTIDGCNYHVEFEKDKQGGWQLQKHWQVNL